MRLLVVEDEIRMAKLIKRGLEEEGHAVDLVEDGAGAIWHATSTEYSAILLDVMLPDESGFEVCRKLREVGVRTPVMMLTARVEVADRVRGLDAGADDYLVKPFSFSELAARLRAIGRRDDRIVGTTLEVDDLKLDPSTRKVTRGGVEIELTPKEFALLELFMRRPGKVLSRTQILEAVWDFAYEGGSNVIDQYIAYLRRKIDRPFKRNDLETVRGVGYRLRSDSTVRRDASVLPDGGVRARGNG